MVGVVDGKLHQADWNNKEKTVQLGGIEEKDKKEGKDGSQKATAAPQQTMRTREYDLDHTGLRFQTMMSSTHNLGHKV